MWLRACTSADEGLAHISVRNIAAFWEKGERGVRGSLAFSSGLYYHCKPPTEKNESTPGQSSNVSLRAAWDPKGARLAVRPNSQGLTPDPVRGYGSGAILMAFGSLVDIQFLGLLFLWEAAVISH